LPVNVEDTVPVGVAALPVNVDTGSATEVPVNVEAGSAAPVPLNMGNVANAAVIPLTALAVAPPPVSLTAVTIGVAPAETVRLTVVCASNNVPPLCAWPVPPFGSVIVIAGEVTVPAGVKLLA
jgi:hypothetical protein